MHNAPIGFLNDSNPTVHKSHTEARPEPLTASAGDCTNLRCVLTLPAGARGSATIAKLRRSRRAVSGLNALDASNPARSVERDQWTQSS
jgi:hypothetical protein